MGTIWLHPVTWASLWQTWYDLFIWFSLEPVDFTNHFFSPFLMWWQCCKMYQEMCQFRLKLHVNISWYFPVSDAFCYYTDFLCNLFQAWATWACLIVYIMFTHFCVQWMLLPQAWLCEDRTVRKLEWGFEIYNLLSSPSANSCCPFLPCCIPTCCSVRAARYCRPVAVPQHCGLALQHLIFCNHTVNFPLWGTGTPCCRQVPLRGWADVLEHIGFVLRRTQCSINLFFSL